MTKTSAGRSRAAGRSVNWTTFDMPSSITKGGGTVSFVYGPEHQRTRQGRGADGTVDAGGQEVETNGGEVKVKTYWPLGIGVEIDTVGKGTALYWIHKDRLGSPVVIANQNGVLRDPLAYDAWGKRRSQDGASTDDEITGKVDNKGFTGHEMLDTVDLVHMNGRVYDRQLGRFLSADPLVQDPLNGQSYNRYSYVLNNPTNLTDPSGFQAECKLTMCGAGDWKTIYQAPSESGAGTEKKDKDKGQAAKKDSNGTVVSDAKKVSSAISGGTPATRSDSSPIPGCTDPNCVVIPGERGTNSEVSNNRFNNIELTNGDRPQLSLGYVGKRYGKAYVHTYVILSQGGADGRRYYLRAGPDESGNGLGNITVSYGDDARKLDVPRNLATQHLGDVDMSFDDAKNALMKFGQSVDAAHIPYTFTANSNSVAAQAPTAVGLPRAAPSDELGEPKGYDTVLKVKPIR